MLTLVDAARWEMLIAVVEPLVTAQIEAADIVAVNKVDEVDDKALAAIIESVGSLARQGDGPSRSLPRPVQA